MIQFAAAHAIVTCPNGPLVQKFVGRMDSSEPAPEGLLPGSNTPGDEVIASFKDKGFNELDLALMRAHTVSRQFFADPSQAGVPQDVRPGLWDVTFYIEQFSPSPGTFRFPSMSDLSEHPNVGLRFRIFLINPGQWSDDFTDTMTRLSVLGVPGGTKGLIDCTEALPPRVVGSG